MNMEAAPLRDVEFSCAAVIFDLDGTLVDSAPVIASLLNGMRAGLKLPELPLPRYAGWISLGAEELIAHALEFDAAAGQAGIAAALMQFRRLYMQAETPLSTIYPGVPAVLRELLEAGVRLGVCSNKPRRLVDKVLAETGLAAYFGCVLAGDDLPTRKPDPAGLMACLRQLDASPDKALFVGDSSVDQACAKNAGLPFAFFASGYDDGVRPHDAAFVFRDYALLPDHVFCQGRHHATH